MDRLRFLATSALALSGRWTNFLEAPMTDAELRDAAVAELKQTTIGYVNSSWTVPPAGTHWKAGLDYLAQIQGGVVTPPSNIIKSDPCTDPDFQKLWGASADAMVSPSRVVTSGGFRRVNLVDGDNVFGERSQIGRNTWNQPTFCVFKEGDHRVITWRERFPASFNMGASSWQQVLQVKQAQPYAADRTHQPNSQGVSLEIQIYGGFVHLQSWWTSRATIPAPKADTWSDWRFEVLFSQDPAKGSAKLTIGSATVSWKGATMAYESGSSAVKVGASIPAALMMGIYRATPIGGNTYVDIQNVQVTS